MEPNSSEYLLRCLDTLKADNNISDETKVVMFNEYARILNQENNTQDVHEIVHVLNLAQSEIRAMYKRLGYKSSNILEAVDEALEKYVNQAVRVAPEPEPLPEQTGTDNLPLSDDELPPPVFAPEI